MSVLRSVLRTSGGGGVIPNTFSGNLPVTFSRNAATLTPSGDAVASGEIRYDLATPIYKTALWEDARSISGNSTLIGSQWEADGQTPYAVFSNNQSLLIWRGGSIDDAPDETIDCDDGSGNFDLASGFSVTSDFRYDARAGFVCHGLIVMLCQRIRVIGGATEGVSLFSIQKVNGTWVADVEDMVGLDSGNSDYFGGGPVREWAMPGYFVAPEVTGTPNEIWFGIADYRSQGGDGAEGGQGFIARARRTYFGGEWEVDAPFKVSEFFGASHIKKHLHTVGIAFDSGNLIALCEYGDGENSETTRRVCTDPSDYTNASNWTTEQRAFFGRPSDVSGAQKQAAQAISAIQGKEDGTVLMGSDHGVHSVLRFNLKDIADGNEAPLTSTALIDRGYWFNHAGEQNGVFSLWLHKPEPEKRSSLVVARMEPIRPNTTDAFTIASNANRVICSLDGGDNWIELPWPNASPLIVGRYGDHIIHDTKGGSIRKIAIPATKMRQPILLNPGGTNRLRSTDFSTFGSISATTMLVKSKGETAFLDPADDSVLPPVDTFAHMAVHCFTDDTIPSSLNLGRLNAMAGTYDATGEPVCSDFRVINLGDNANRLRTSHDTEDIRFVPRQWTPYFLSDESSAAAQPFNAFFFATGITPSVVNYLVTVVGYYVGQRFPAYPLAAQAVGPNEVLDVNLRLSSSAWTVGVYQISTHYTNSVEHPRFSEYVFWHLYTDADNWIEVKHSLIAPASGDPSIDVRISIAGEVTTISLGPVWLNAETPIKVVISYNGSDTVTATAFCGVTVLSGTASATPARPVTFKYGGEDGARVPIKIAGIRSANSVKTFAEMDDLIVGSVPAVSESATRLPSGGTVGTSGDFTIHTFTADGTLVFEDEMEINYMIFGGGGRGGASIIGEGGAGGGGAGGYLTGSAILSPGEYAVTIGSGGDNDNPQGGNTIFNSLTALGGGRGGDDNADNAAVGGSGGGGAGSRPLTGNFSPAAGTSGQGFSGGDGTLTSTAGLRDGGGGGGASGLGGTPTTAGAGVSSPVPEDSATYCSGGTGGLGNEVIDTGVAGGENTGSGGSGARRNLQPYSGGSGKAVIWFVTPD